MWIKFGHKQQASRKRESKQEFYVESARGVPIRRLSLSERSKARVGVSHANTTIHQQYESNMAETLENITLFLASK